MSNADVNHTRRYVCDLFSEKKNHKWDNVVLNLLDQELTSWWLRRRTIDSLFFLFYT